MNVPNIIQTQRRTKVLFCLTETKFNKEELSVVLRPVKDAQEHSSKANCEPEWINCLYLNI